VVTSYVPAPFDGSQSCFNALGVDATSVYWTGTNAAWGAKHVFSAVDHYVWWPIYRWLRKKHVRAAGGDGAHGGVPVDGEVWDQGGLRLRPP